MKNTQGCFAQFPQLFWEFEILLKSEVFKDEQDLVRREEVGRAFQKKPRLHNGLVAIFLKSISYVPGKLKRRQ